MARIATFTKTEKTVKILPDKESIESLIKRGEEMMDTLIKKLIDHGDITIGHLTARKPKAKGEPFTFIIWYSPDREKTVLEALKEFEVEGGL